MLEEVIQGTKRYSKTFLEKNPGVDKVADAIAGRVQLSGRELLQVRQALLHMLHAGDFPDPQRAMAALFPARFVASDALLGTRFWVGPDLAQPTTWGAAPPELARYMLGLEETTLRLWAGDDGVADGV